MTDALTPDLVVAELEQHPHQRELIALVRRAALEAAKQRDASFASLPGQDRPERPAPAPPEGLGVEELNSKYGNVLDILGHGVTTPTEALLLGTLLALAAREEPPADEDELELVTDMTWLAAHTPCDALLSLEAAAGERESVWDALGRIASAPAEAAPDFGRAEALLAAAALGTSLRAQASSPRTRALARVQDPAVRALLASGGVAREPLQGELVPAPFGPTVTAILAATLVLGAYQLVRLLGRVAFGYQRPAAFTLTERGLELTYRVELLGKVRREDTLLMPLASLSSLTREVQYPRAGLYAGLAALVIGTYFGMGLFVDALRVPGGSGSLMSMAVALIVAGLAIDFVLSSGLDGMRGKCRLIVEPRHGRTLCLAAVDPVRADAMLANVTAVASGAHGPSLLPPPPA